LKTGWRIKGINTSKLNKYLKVLFYIVLPLVLLNCNLFKKTSSVLHEGMISEITLDKIICGNLSEDMNRVSSHNDEILLLCFLMDSNGNISTAWSSEYMLFESRGVEVKLNHFIAINNASFLKIFLLEQDTERTESELLALVQNNIDKSKEDLAKIIKDDDLLYLKTFDLNQAQFYKENKLKMWGVHIGDEYEYWLGFRVR